MRRRSKKSFVMVLLQGAGSTASYSAETGGPEMAKEHPGPETRPFYIDLEQNADFMSSRFLRYDVQIRGDDVAIYFGTHMGTSRHGSSPEPYTTDHADAVRYDDNIGLS